MSEWPPRWDGPRFKVPVAQKVMRARKRMARATLERDEMHEARRRDKVCRFPGCGCRKFDLRTHVSHLRHRGAGGNPAGDRTQTAGLILVCSARHRENRVSLDRGTLRWRALTDAGADGPVAWDVEMSALRGRQGPSRPLWREVARETSIRHWEPFTPDQQVVLDTLAGMLL